MTVSDLAAAPEILRAAVEHGLLSRRDLVAGLAGVRATPGREAYVVLLGRREVGTMRRLPTVAAADRERDVLRVAADAGLGPVPLPGADATVWTRSVPGVALLGLGPTGMPDLAATCAAWGAALARLHTLPVRGAGRVAAPRPVVLAPASVAAAGPVLGRVLVDAADRWEERTWIHGRPGLAETLLAAGAVAFRDWSAAGVGDPGWDLAGACVATRRLAERHRVSAEALESYLLLGYRGHQGPARLEPAFRAAQLVADGRLEAARQVATRTARLGLAA